MSLMSMANVMWTVLMFSCQCCLSLGWFVWLNVDEICVLYGLHGGDKDEVDEIVVDADDDIVDAYRGKPVRITPSIPQEWFCEKRCEMETALFTKYFTQNLLL